MCIKTLLHPDAILDLHMHIYCKSWVSLIPPIPIQHHGAHCRKFASFSDKRNLILNILNLFTYCISSLIWNPFLLPPSLPTWTLTSLQPSYPGLGYAHRMGTCSASLGFSTLCWWPPMTGCLPHPVCCGHVGQPSWVVTPLLDLSSDTLSWASVALSFRDKCLPYSAHFVASGLCCWARKARKKGEG